MSTQKKGDTMAVKFTHGKVQGFSCKGKKAAFLYDSGVKGLGLRATPGTKVYIYQGRLNGKVLRHRIGDTRTWTLDEARQEATKIQAMVDQGIDPREAKREKLAEIDQREAEAQRESLTVLDAWTAYIEARREGWSDRHIKDHYILSRPGGEPAKRGKKKIQPGPMAQFMDMMLSEITADSVEAWLKKETPGKPGRMRLAFSLLRAFLNWCEIQDEYRGIAEPGACGNHLKREHIPRMTPKDDCLQKEQLKAWFKAVRQLTPGMSAYLQALLLTGARRNELAGLEWDHVDFQWQSLTIHDKVAGTRTISLTPYLASILFVLPRRNQFVFSSPTSESGRLEEPRKPHNKALEVAGIPYLTIHGLRRSFATLSEWQECPVGVVAQIMGHKPSAIAERHYKKRPLDLLRMWHTKIEKFILDQAGIAQPESGQTGLKVVGE
jgi:integrase